MSTAFFVLLLDTTIMTTSLPQMATAFGMRPLDMGLGLTVYSLVLACAAITWPGLIAPLAGPLIGGLAPSHDRRHLFLARSGGGAMSGSFRLWRQRRLSSSARC
jgi:predicted MFS family arabinose efflux permease